MKRIAIALIIAAIALSLAVWRRLPAHIAVHWTTAGQVDTYAPRAVGASIVPLVMAVVALAFTVFPALSPRGFGLDPRARGYKAIAVAIMLFLSALHGFIIFTALRIAPSVTTVMPILLGGLLIVLGNYLPKVPRNFFVGIRTPWTIADPDVWYRTHRVGGIVFMLSGVLLMAVGPLLTGAAMDALMIAVIAVAALTSLIYSFAIYRKSHQGDIS
jgi:uncharacterized membrane protein